MKGSLKLFLFIFSFLFGCSMLISAEQKGIEITNKLLEHPCLFFQKQDENVLKNKLASEVLLMQTHQLIIDESDSLLLSPLLKRNQVGRRILHTSRESIRRIMYLSYSFRMTGQIKYSKRAEEEMINLASFNDWNPTHFLDVAEMTLALSIGYDWLFDQISANNKAIIEEAILNKGIRPSTETKYNKWLKNTNNWNQVCNAGISAGVVAIFNTNPSEFAPLLQRAISSLPLAMHEYANDGGYPEGYNYWGYGTTFNILILEMLTQNWKTDFGLKAFPGFMQTAVFMQNMEGNFLPTKNNSYRDTHSFNYADGNESSTLNPAMFWFAGENNDNSIVFSEIKKLKTNLEFDQNELRKNRFLPLLLVWSKNIDFKNIATPKRKMFVSNGKTETAMMRTSWTDNNGIYVGIKAGTPSASHQHMDVGSFILEANGVRWAMDFGSQDYNSLESQGVDLWNRAQDSQRWDVFRYKNTSHNTLTINNNKQLVAGNAYVKIISEKETNMAVSMDLTSLYQFDAKKVERKISLLNKNKLLVEDLVSTLDKEIVLRWNMLTKSSPEIIDEQTIRLTQNDKKMIVKLTGIDEGKAFINSTVSPNAYDPSNDGTSFIGFDIIIPANSSKNLIVTFTPIN